MQSTRKEVAAAAGVSPAMVSAALGGRPSTIRMSKETRDRILAAAAALDYHPNILAQGLKQKHSFLIGLSYYDSNGNILAPLLRGIESALSGSDYSVVVEMHRDAASEAAALLRLRHRRVAGLIATAAQDRDGRPSEALLDMQRQGRPLVELFGKVIPGAAHFNPDHEGTGRILTRHLIAEGRRRIALLTHSATATCRGGLFFNAWENQQGYLAAIAEAGLSPRIVHYPVPAESGDLAMLRQNYEGGLAALSNLLRGESPDAVLCFDSVAAAGLHRACLEKGLKLRICGLEKDVAALSCNPPLPGVVYDYDELGRRSMLALLRKMSGGEAQSWSMPGRIES
ncbi:MAG: hypothetical protein RL095_1167 [Verrucomicrobiota bacterium]|jgi:LacI family transcriptional regulator